MRATGARLASRAWLASAATAAARTEGVSAWPASCATTRPQTAAAAATRPWPAPPAAAAAAALSTSARAAAAAAAAAQPEPAAVEPAPKTKGPRYTIAAAAAAARAGTLRAAPTASGVLVDPYRGEPPPLPPSAWVTPSGWRARWARWVGGAKSMYTLAKLRKLVPGFDLPGFKGEAAALYASTCRALAAGDRPFLRDALTPTEYTAAKRQLRAREEGGWAGVEWGLAGGGEAGGGGGGGGGPRVEVLRARLVMANPRDERAGFAQVTVGVDSVQTFVARDGRGRVVATSAPDGVSLGGGGGGGGGAPSSPPSPPAMAVRDVWVLERYLGGGPSARWRVAARLPDPPPRAPPPRWWVWLGGGRR